MARIILILIAVVAASCYAPTARDCAVRCGTGNACPDDLDCVAGMCRSIGETMACGVESERCGIGGCEADETCQDCPADCGSCTPHCGSPSHLTDDFALPNPQPGWSPGGSGNGRALEQANLLSLAPGLPVQQVPGSASYRSYVSHDFREGRIAIEIEEMIDVTSNGFAALALSTPDYRLIRIIQQSGTLYFDLGLVSEALAQVDYDPIEHRHWRLREHGGYTFWETSRDGRDWFVHINIRDPYPLDNVNIVLDAGGGYDQRDPGRFEVAGALGGDGPLEFCPASSHTEAFDDGTTTAQLGEINCAITIRDGNMQFQPEGVEKDGCFATFSFARDFRNGGSVTADVESFAMGPYAINSIGVVGAPAHNLAVHALNGVLLTYWQSGDAPAYEPTMITYNPSAHRYIRFREQAGRMHFALSPDDLTWTDVFDIAWPADLARRTFVQLGVVTTQASSGPGTMRVREVKWR